jgi:hypothetical protein
MGSHEHDYHHLAYALSFSVLRDLRQHRYRIIHSRCRHKQVIMITPTERITTDTPIRKLSSNHDHKSHSVKAGVDLQHNHATGELVLEIWTMSLQIRQRGDYCGPLSFSEGTSGWRMLGVLGAARGINGNSGEDEGFGMDEEMES